MTEKTASSTSDQVVRNLRAVILLGGQVGRNPLADGVGRSALDLPAGSGRTVLDLWLAHLDEFARAFDLPQVRVCISVDQAGFLPRVRPAAEHPRVEVEVVRDPAEYRGTAGVVRDLTRDYADGDWVLVAAANQILRERLRDVFDALCAQGESVTIVPSGDSELAGFFLLRCARMRDVPDVGFVDLKEQAIPLARGHAPLSVVRRAAGSALPVRTLAEYTHALRAVHSPGPSASLEDPFAEAWEPAFAIVEEGASVAPGAVLQDSVVLAGGRVEPEAAAVRSVICDRGVVRRAQCIVESIVTGEK